MQSREVTAEIWTAAFQRQIDETKRLEIPARAEPYYVDGPLVLSSGSTIVAAPEAEIRLVPGANTCIVRNANLVGFNHHVRMTTALGWLEPVTCNLEPQAKWIAEIDRIHKASVHRAGMRNPTRVQTFRHLPKTGLADVERKMMQRTCRLWYVRGIGLAFFIGEDRDQSAIARIEIQVPLVRIIEVRLVEDEWHSQNALPEIDRRLAVGTDNRDVMDALGLDLPDRLGF